MTEDRRVLVHSCYCIVQDQPESALVPDVNYVSADAAPVGSSEAWFHVLPFKCKCRKRISFHEAEEQMQVGRARPIIRYTAKARINTVLDHENFSRGSYGGTPMVWMPIVRAQTPRVDLITSIDIERAFCCDCRREPGQKLWKKFHSKDCSGRRHSRYIDEVHQIYLDNRAELIVPFSPDPFEGRVLFINFEEGPRPSKGRDVSPAEWAEIQGRLDDSD